tara:strand:- start:12778 stop:13482 length:705 start_codon:yes stop_codon:yes gene_type:complete
MKDEKEFYRFWKKYINRNLYRVISSEYLSNVKKNGLNPKKDPYQKLIPEIKELFKLVIKLEKKGFIHKQDWGFKKVTGKYIVNVSSEDIDSPFIDFTPNYKETHYYKKHKGGALIQTIRRIIEDILKRKPKLLSNELTLVNKIDKWSKKKSKFNNKILFVNGSSKYFETALFQNRLGKKGKDKYWKSPFGRFEHFVSIIKKYGLKRYESYLKGEKLFYLRIISKIPAKEIEKIV